MPNKSFVYRLRKMEQVLSWCIAAERQDQDDRGGYPDPRSGASSLENMAYSYGAELAYCKLHNVYPDIQAGVMNPQDCIVDGIRVNVKWTKYLDGKLLVPDKRDMEHPDVYALVVGCFPNYEYKGWCYKDSIINPEHHHDEWMGRSNPCWTMDQDSLIMVHVRVFDDAMRGKNV